MAGDDALTATVPEEADVEVDAGFEFAFDNEAFSDKVLRIEVFDSSMEDAPGSGADAASRKRRRQEAQGDDGEGINSSRTMMGTPILRVKTIKVNSAILAAKSNFFFKLFSNGMKESGLRQSTVRITDSEENAFMELLCFMYSGKLTPTSDPTLLVDILMAADKFEVVSCMKLCCQRLIAMPMTLESAVWCLDLPSSISMAAELIEAAKKFLSKRYKEFISPKFQDELLRIPLAGIEAILSRNDLGVASQVAVYDFVLRWGFSQYPNPEERHKILSSRLLPRVHDMIIDNPTFEKKFLLKREQCFGIFPSGSLSRKGFRFAESIFYLSFECNTEPSSCFGFLLDRFAEKWPVKGAIDYKFEVKTRPLLQYVTMYECISTGSRKAVECKDLFGVPWSEFIADDSPFFIKGILDLRICLKMTQKPL